MATSAAAARGADPRGGPHRTAPRRDGLGWARRQGRGQRRPGGGGGCPSALPAHRPLLLRRRRRRPVPPSRRRRSALWCRGAAPRRSPAAGGGLGSLRPWVVLQNTPQVACVKYLSHTEHSRLTPQFRRVRGPPAERPLSSSVSPRCCLRSPGAACLLRVKTGKVAGLRSFQLAELGERNWRDHFSEKAYFSLCFQPV